MVRIVRAVLDAIAPSRAARRAERAEVRGTTSRRGTATPTSGSSGHAASPRPTSAAPDAATYPGDFTGVVRPTYSPRPDGDPDPGEIVWTWVPYEEDHTRGKDRPVLLVGHDERWLLGLMLTSRDHDTRPDRGSGRWLDLGVGDWDPRGRPSEVRLDRVLRLDPRAVRREGAVLDRTRFAAVAGSLGAVPD